LDLENSNLSFIKKALKDAIRRQSVAPAVAQFREGTGT
jgi:hypothetical protein